MADDYGDGVEGLERLLALRKLSLVLDLDHTLLHCGTDPMGWQVLASSELAWRCASDAIAIAIGSQPGTIASQPAHPQPYRLLNTR